MFYFRYILKIFYRKLKKYQNKGIKSLYIICERVKRIDHSGLITHEILGSTPRLATKRFGDLK